MPASRKAVLLVQLGGPEDRSQLRPFLYRLLSDPNVLPIPPAAVRHSVAWLIATTRAARSARMYELIGWSPVRYWTELTAELLARRVADGSDEPAPLVRAAMTCSPPLVEDVLAELRSEGIDHLTVLPLYPQYSTTTTKGVHESVESTLQRMDWHPQVRMAPDAWFGTPAFIAAHVDRITECAGTLPDPDPSATVILYSAHSIPRSAVDRRQDPYPGQIEQTRQMIDTALSHRYRSVLGYQSKVGPVAWLEPSTTAIITQLAAEGVQQVILSPIAFVSDHVETLYEARILYAGQATREGIAHFATATGLNDHPLYIQALADVLSTAAN